MLDKTIQICTDYKGSHIYMNKTFCYTRNWIKITNIVDSKYTD